MLAEHVGISILVGKVDTGSQWVELSYMMDSEGEMVTLAPASTFALRPNPLVQNRLLFHRTSYISWWIGSKI